MHPWPCQWYPKGTLHPTHPPPLHRPAPPSLTQKAAGAAWPPDVGCECPPTPCIHVEGEPPPLESAFLMGQAGKWGIRKGAARLRVGGDPTRGQPGHPCDFGSPWASYKVMVKSSCSGQAALGQGRQSCEVQTIAFSQCLVFFICPHWVIQS